VVEQLAKDAAEMLAQPEVRERLKLQGMTDAAMKPAEFASYIRDETAVWAKIIKARNIVAE
jgi:tripartite-type tricarboxylate transporter receptor subunit TctC